MRAGVLTLVLLVGCVDKVVDVSLPDPQDAGDAAVSTADAPEASPADAAPDVLADDAPDGPSGPPACAGAPTSTVDDALTCAEQYCSSKLGDPSGVINFPGFDGGQGCLIADCAGQFVTLENVNLSCFDCIDHTLVAGATFTATRSVCIGPQ